MTKSCISCVFRMIRRHDFCHKFSHPVCFLVGCFIELPEFLFKCCIIHLDRFADMDQLVWRLLHAFFCHQEFFEEFLARTQAGVLDFDVYIRCESGQANQVSCHLIDPDWFTHVQDEDFAAFCVVCLPEGPVIRLPGWS